MNALLIDFDDSFTYNILQELEETGLKVQLINWKDFECLPDERTILVLGPGPGHPDDYEAIFPLIRNWLADKRPFLGICLGHQLFWRLQGEDILRSRHPMHGQRIRLDLGAEWLSWLGLKSAPQVQRYNSLAVFSQATLRNHHLTNFIQDDEILITRGENIITYQFHPESVGTSYRQAFFRPVLRDLV